MRDTKFFLTIHISLVFVGMALNVFAQENPPEKVSVSLNNVEPIKLELEGVVVCDENGEKRHQSILKENFTKDSTVLDVVSILGPGYIPKLSGTGSITWYFDDGSKIITRLWPKSLNSKVQLEYN